MTPACPYLDLLVVLDLDPVVLVLELLVVLVLDLLVVLVLADFFLGL